MNLLADLSWRTVHFRDADRAKSSTCTRWTSPHARHVLRSAAPILHCTAIGKVLMAWEHPERRDRILDGAPSRSSARDHHRPQRVPQGLEQVRQQRFAEDREEFDDHIRCVGVPIFDRLGQPWPS